MKIGRLTINLAQQKKPNTDAEIGTGNLNPSFFAGEVIDVSKVKIKDLIKMRQNDGTVQSLYSIITLPILANNWSIEPDEDAPDNEAAKAQAAFVKQALTLPPHKGGMTTPFRLVLADMLRAVLEGYRAYEKVYTLNDAGQVVYRKIAQRDNQTIILKTDERGGFNGLKQYAYIGDEFKEVEIPREYSFVFTYGKEFNWLFGESAFRAAYYSYDKKHRLYYLYNQAAQEFAIPTKIGSAAPGGKQGEIDSLTESLDELNMKSSIAIPNGADVKGLDSSMRMDMIPGIDHHNAEMARSVLAHFILLGTGSSTGSWALSSDQSDMFLIAERGLMELIEDHINSYLLPDLIDYNFATPYYPAFKFGDMTDATREIVKEAFMKIADKMPAGIPDWLVTGIATRMADTLDLDKPEGASDEGTYGAKSTPDVQPADAKISDQSHSHKKKVQLASGKWSRALTPAEGVVNFTGLQKKQDTLQEDFAKEAKVIWSGLKSTAVKNARKLLEAKDYKALSELSLGNDTPYVSLISQNMLDAYTYAKNGAADEINRKIPPTATASKTVIQQKAKAVADKQFTDVLFGIKNKVTEAIRKNTLSKTDLSIGDLLSDISDLFDDFFPNSVETGASAFLAAAINMGRDDVFQQYKNSIQSYQYSAILDENVCPTCEDLDATVVDEAGYTGTEWQPPIHFNCRCIWVAIMSDEEEPPDLTGFPESPGGTDKPSLSEPYCKSTKLSDNKA